MQPVAANWPLRLLAPPWALDPPSPASTFHSFETLKNDFDFNPIICHITKYNYYISVLFSRVAFAARLHFAGMDSFAD